MNLEEFISQFGEQRTHEFAITESVYSAFQQCSGDANPLHVNGDYATSKGFAGKVMYGNILNSFVSYFVGMCMPIPEVMLLKQDILYLQPLYLGDSVNMTVSIAESFPKFNMLEFKFSFKRDNTLVARGHFQIKLL